MNDADVCESQPSNETILVVEDSEAIRRVVCFMLRQTGYTCLEAGDGAEALKLMRAEADIQLVLTDVVMPKMGGAELGRYLAREYPTVRVLFMSGYSDDPLVRTIEQTPIFLAKPFTSNALTTTVRRALEHPWPGLPEWSAGFTSR
jgi:two-component system cell cycle sensor histidine kinase/response regulator CckA